MNTSDEESVTASEVEGDAESDVEAEAAKKAARPKRKRAGSADLQPVQAEKEYWGPPKPHKFNMH